MYIRRAGSAMLSCGVQGRFSTYPEMLTWRQAGGTETHSESEPHNPLPSAKPLRTHTAAEPLVAQPDPATRRSRFAYCHVAIVGRGDNTPKFKYLPTTPAACLPAARRMLMGET